MAAYAQPTAGGSGRSWGLRALLGGLACASLCAGPGIADSQPRISRGKLTIRHRGRDIPRDHVEFPPLRLAGSGLEELTALAVAPPPEDGADRLPTPAPTISPTPTTAMATLPQDGQRPVGTTDTAATAGPTPPSDAPTTVPDASQPAAACRADSSTGEAAVRCSDGKVWTMRSAGLILPPVLRCSSKHPECCQIGFRKLRDVQLADLLRVGEGQAPVCYMRVGDFLTNPPSPGYAATTHDRLDDELPPSLRVHKDCPKGRYLALGACHDPSDLMRSLRPPSVDDRNRTLVPEANEVVERMRREFDQSGRCPQAALDIEVLKRIYNAAQLRLQLVADTPLDVEPLIAQPSSPGASEPEPRLPASCGYNATYQTWFQTTFHCASQKTCFAQSHSSLPHTCAQFQRATTAGGTSPYFWPWANCQNVPFCSAVSSARIECTGGARLTALGRGVFLMIQEDTASAPYFYGVLFARPRARTAEEAQAAKRSRALLQDMARNLPKESERQRMYDLLSSQPD